MTVDLEELSLATLGACGAHELPEAINEMASGELLVVTNNHYAGQLDLTHRPRVIRTNIDDALTMVGYVLGLMPVRMITYLSSERLLDGPPPSFGLEETLFRTRLTMLLHRLGAPEDYLALMDHHQLTSPDHEYPWYEQAAVVVTTTDPRPWALHYLIKL